MDDLTETGRRAIVFPLACLAAAAMVIMSESAYRQSTLAMDKLDTVNRVRASIHGLEQGLLDAESGQRGYLLTGRGEYLQPYRDAVAKVDGTWKILDPYYSGQPESRELLRQLRVSTDRKLQELEAAIRSRGDAQVDALQMKATGGEGKSSMDAIRSIDAQLLERERHNDMQGRDDIARTLMLSRIGVAALSAVSLLAFLMVLRRSGELKRQQMRLQVTMQAETDRLESEVLRRTSELTELTQHLQTAREDERSRLARDLHDELGALLTSAKLDTARIKARLAGSSPEALERLAHLVETLNSGIALKRRIVEDLRPSSLSNLGLGATLEILAREFAEQSGIDVHCALAPVQLSPAAELVVYRLVQEAITNIAKYARASNVWVSMSMQDGLVEISVRDDGVGFDSTRPPRSAYGLVGMRFRIEAEGGTLLVLSRPGEGTQIRVTLPESMAMDSSPPE